MNLICTKEKASVGDAVIITNALSENLYKNHDIFLVSAADEKSGDISVINHEGKHMCLLYSEYFVIGLSLF